MEITANMVKELRTLTGAGLMDCKNALTLHDGDMDKSIEYLREKGIASATKKAGRIAAEGVVESYIHTGGRIGVLVEVNCETDFVAKTDDFRSLVRDIALQIAAMNPKYICQNCVPAAEVDKERSILKEQTLAEGKPENVVDKIVEGRLLKYFKEICLMDQAYVKENDKTIERLVKEHIAKFGENISIRRFVRYELGEGIEKKQEDFASEVRAQLG